MSSPRLAAACFAGAVMPALVLTGYVAISELLSGNIDMLFAMTGMTFVMAGFWAFVHICVLGLPLFFLLRKHNWINIWTATFGGFLVGGSPSALILGTSLWFGGATADTWHGLASTFAYFGLFGAMGGLAAWAIWRFGPDIPDR